MKSYLFPSVVITNVEINCFIYVFTEYLNANNCCRNSPEPAAVRLLSRGFFIIIIISPTLISSWLLRGLVWHFIREPGKFVKKKHELNSLLNSSYEPNTHVHTHMAESEVAYMNYVTPLWPACTCCATAESMQSFVSTIKQSKRWLLKWMDIWTGDLKYRFNVKTAITYSHLEKGEKTTSTHLEAPTLRLLISVERSKDARLNNTFVNYSSGCCGDCRAFGTAGVLK